MPIVSLTLNQSLTGTFQATPRGTFPEPVTGKLVVQQPFTSAIAAGNSSLNIPASNSAGTSYLFEVFQSTSIDDFFLQDGSLYASTDPDLGKTSLPRWQWLTGAGFNNQWYTGSQLTSSPPTSDNKLLTKVTRSKKTYLIDPFDAIVATADVNLKDLQDLGITTNQLEYSALRVADILTSNPTFSSRLPKGIAFQGAYNAATSYVKDQAVQYNGALWIYVAASTLAGITPGTNNLVWQLGVDKGSPGGVGANSIGWNRTNWLNASFSGDAVSRQDAVGLFDAIPQPTLTNYLTLDGTETLTGAKTFNANAQFNSRVFIPTRPLTDSDTNAVNIKVLKDAIAAVNKLPMPVGWGRIGAAVSTPAGTNTAATIVYSDRPFSAGNIVNNVGDITIAETGFYLFIYSFAFSIFSNFNGTANRIRIRAFLNRFTGAPTGNTGELLRMEQGTLTGSGTIEYQGSGIRLMDCTAGQAYNTQFALNGADADGAGASSSATAINSIQRNQVMVWRVG